MKKKLAFMSSLGYEKMKPEQVCRSLSEIGYDGIEWTLHHFNPRTHSKKQRRDLVKLTHAYGLEVSEVVVQQDMVLLNANKRNDIVKLVLQCIEAAADAGVSTLNLFSGPIPWNKKPLRIGVDVTEGAAWDMIFRAFDKFVKSAEKYKVNLALEGVWGMICHDFFTTRYLIDKYDSKYLGVNFDPSHDVLYDHLDSGWLARQWGPGRIKHCHIKDAAGIPIIDKFLYPLPGEGNVDWVGFEKALDEMKYKGFMSVEYESFIYYNKILKGDVEEAARRSFEQMQRLFKEI